jgi:hypothetical protein
MASSGGRGDVLDLEQEVAPERRSGERDVDLVGQPRVELPGLIVDRHLLLVLASGDLCEREIVAHWATCVASVA